MKLVYKLLIFSGSVWYLSESDFHFNHLTLLLGNQFFYGAEERDRVLKAKRKLD